MKKIGLVIVVLVLLIIATAGYLYTQISEAGDRWPMENEPGSLTHTINRLEKEVADLMLEVTKIEPAKERLTAVKIDYELAKQVLPQESSPDHLIAAIRTKAEQSGVYPSSLTPSVTKGGGGNANFETWRFSLTVDGSYDQLAAFVNRMEEFESADASKTGSVKRFFELIELSVASKNNGLANLMPGSVGRDVSHRCTMVMQTYRYTGN